MLSGGFPHSIPRSTTAHVTLARSLGQFTPSLLSLEVIGAEFQQWLIARRITQATLMLSKNRLPIGVRNPDDHLRISTTDKVVMDWHRDGLGEYATDPEKTPDIRWMILWSNRSPTELRDREGNRLYFEPYDVVLADNHNVWHRCPPPEEGRWFARLNDPIIE